MTTRFRFTDRAAPRVQIGLGSTVELSSSLWDVAEWDDATSTWAGTEPTWRDVDCEIISAHLETGRPRITDPFTPGRAEIVADNASGWADPTVAADIPGVLTMRPGRSIRVGIEHSTLGTVWKWRGFIDAVEPVYSPTDWDTVMLRCIDTLGEAGRGTLSDTVETGADETAPDRINRLLDRKRWPVLLRDVFSASTALYAAVLEGKYIDALQRTADSAGGWIFGDELGNVAFRGRDWLFYPNGFAADAVIGNVDETDVCPYEFQRAFDRKSIATQVTIERSAPDDVDPPPDPIVLEDTPGQVLYGVEPFDRTDLWTRDDDEASRIGTRILETRNASSSMPRVAAVSLDASTGPAALDVMTQVTATGTTPSRYRCRFQRPADGELVFDDQFFAVGVVHDISADEWLCHISLDRADYFESLAPPPYLWDVALWSRSLWN